MIKLIRLRRWLQAVWLANVVFNASFFIWVAMEMKNSVDLHQERMRNMIMSKAHNTTRLHTKLYNIPLDQTLEIAILLTRELLWSVYGFGWLMNTVLFMIWICYANYLVEEETISSIVCSGGPGRDGAECKVATMYRVLSVLTGLTERINQQLGILPLLWLCELFISTCLRLTQIAVLVSMQKTSELKQQLENLLMHKIVFSYFENFVEYIALSGCYFCFIIAAEHFRSKRVSLNRLQSQLFLMVQHEQQVESYNPFGNIRLCTPSKNSQVSLHILANEMTHKFSRSEYRTWCNFPLGYRTLFSFTNALAPFSIMILQLNGY